MLDVKSKQKLIDLLYSSGAFRFPKTKNSESLPYEIRLQYLTSQPKILHFTAKLLWSVIKKETFDLVAGPYTDIPLATTISLEYNWPMIFIRGERKDHGLGNLEFIRNKGFKCEALINLNDIFVRLFETGKISPAQLNQAKQYFERKRTPSYV